MAELSGTMQYRLTLNVNELRLVLKSLGGRLKDEDTLPAKELGDRITVLRCQQTAQTLEANEKLLKNIEASTEDKPIGA